MKKAGVMPSGGETFQFQRPRVNERLSRAAQISIEVAALASRLANEERTRCDHPNGRAENVAEHSFMLARVAPELAELFYSDLDPNLVARFAIIHDDVEAYVGDTPTDRITEQGWLDKQERERMGLEQLKKEYAHLPTYVSLVANYEAQEIPEARFVRVVDKLMVILIHIPNEGETLRKHWTHTSTRDHAAARASELLEQYPEFAEIVLIRNELVEHNADAYLSDTKPRGR